MSEPIVEQKQAIVVQKRDIASFATASWDDMRRMAGEMATSDLLPVHLKGKPASLMIILMTAKELGIGPMQGIDSVDVIQGKRSIKPEAQVALIRSKAPESFISFKEDWATSTFSCTMAPSRDRMDEAFTSTWNDERAKAMGLLTKENYQKQKMTMFKWRAIGDAARTVFPHVTKGIYNSIEAQDFMGGPDDRKSSPSLKEIFKAKAEVVQRTEAEPDLPGASGIEIEN